jgi:tRNA A37 threonylcarbamoyladenosine modification protein TsaB
MTDGTQDQLQVAFPASPTFTRIGRVAVVGLALRLGIDVSTVEQLRAAVDTSVSALQGSGRISAHASWTPFDLTITLSNPDAKIGDQAGLAEQLSDLVGTAMVEPDRVILTLQTETS